MNNLRPKSCLLMIAILGFSINPALFAQHNPRYVDAEEEIAKIVTLAQNWTDEESNEFYSKPQGSRLMPYQWFLHLEQADSEELFLDSRNIRKLGFIPRLKGPGNPDGMPIGFTQDAAYEDGTPGLGVTCAACHTGQIKVGDTLLLIDGAPTMGDFQQLMLDLANALRTTKEDPAKFRRFSNKILGVDATEDQIDGIRVALGQMVDARQGYNNRNLPAMGSPPFGPGRVDAFGAIFNEVGVTFLGIPENHQAANAPVSYPCIWDAPKHKRVQWNGAAENRINVVGEFLFGTKHVGAMGRNAGEVLGVFGNIEINKTELLLPRRYRSTVNRRNLIELEESLDALWSPEWPVDILGPLDPDLVSEGRRIYEANCLRCHKLIDRSNFDRVVGEELVAVGTDPKMGTNFGRMAKTGFLKNRRTTLLSSERFSEEAPIGAILRHVVERSILDPKLNSDLIAKKIFDHDFAAEIELTNALNPGFRINAEIVVGDKQLIGQVDLFMKVAAGYEIEAGRFMLVEESGEKVPEPNRMSTADSFNLQTKEAFNENLDRLNSLTPVLSVAEPDKGQAAVIQNATEVKIAYKARPLNGIWATAPYLHNGSVPNLRELLKPEGERVPRFHIGSIEFDKENVGFKNDPSFPIFDTVSDGNLNSGHNFAADLSETEIKQLLEFLKSL